MSAKDLILIAETVSNEKGVDKEIVLEAIQSALEQATRKRYADMELGVRVDLNRKTGEYQTFRYWDVLPEDDIGFPDRELTLEEAQLKRPGIQMGERIEEPMESVEFGRIAALAAKHVLMDLVRKAEDAKVVNAFKQKLGQLITGVAKKTTRDNIIVDLGNGVEGFLPRDHLLPHEIIRPGDRVRSLLLEVKEQGRRPQILLSRTCPEMLVELFKIEVPEVGEQIIEIKGAARDPGLRAKIAVKTNDGRIDPVGACVGMRGSRVQAVSSELGGERVDIILWDPNPAQLVINAMAPAEVVSILVDEDRHTMDLAIAQEQLSQAIGRNGQNVRLASGLTGWTLNVMSEAEFSSKGAAESEKLLAIFTEALDIDEDFASVLIDAGFSSLEEVAYVPEEEFALIEGLDKETIKEIRTRAGDYLLTKALSKEEKLAEKEPSEDLLSMEGMDKALAYFLATHGICSREDLAEQSIDDLLEIGGFDQDGAGKLIMQAREIWFK